MFDLGLFTALGALGGILFALLIIWTLVWKGFALWIAAGEKKKWWFVALLVFNTLGILEIVFIFLFSDWRKKRKHK